MKLNEITLENCTAVVWANKERAIEVVEVVKAIAEKKISATKTEDVDLMMDTGTEIEPQVDIIGSFAKEILLERTIDIVNALQDKAVDIARVLSNRAVDIARTLPSKAVYIAEALPNKAIEIAEAVPDAMPEILKLYVLED